MTATQTCNLWTPGDWNAFFGFGTNILVNLLTLTALLRFVLKMPDDLVFGRILPADRADAVPVARCTTRGWPTGSRKKTGRTDVCALPSGISVPHMFVVTFVIMLPITLKTGDPIKGWEAGLTWVFIQSFVLMIGGFIAPLIRKITPRAALLGTLAGVSITFISMRPALEMFMTPVIGVVCFAIILLSWFGGVRYFKGIPAGLVAIAVGTAIAWGSTLLGSPIGGMSLGKHRPVVLALRLLGARCRPSATCSPASSSSASSSSPRFRSASTISSRRSTTSRAPPSPATAFRPRACSPPTAWSA